MPSRDLSQRPEDLSGFRHTVLGEMHAGQVKIDEKRPLLRRFVRLAVAGNLGCIAVLWILFRIKDLMPPHEQPFMPALSWYFFFGALYGMFAQTLFAMGRHAERAAIECAVTQNRRYEWHARYDTAGLSEEDLKKVAESATAQAPGRHKRSHAVGAGSRSYFYARIFVVISLGTCLHGLFGAFVNLFMK